MLNESEYIEWISNRDTQDKILKVLQNLANDANLPCEEDRVVGICYTLSKEVGEYGYDFMSRQSDGFSDFFAYSWPKWKLPKWEGAAGEFRREWCAKLVEKLKNDPSLWLL